MGDLFLFVCVKGKEEERIWGKGQVGGGRLRGVEGGETAGGM